MTKLKRHYWLLLLKLGQASHTGAPAQRHSLLALPHHVSRPQGMPWQDTGPADTNGSKAPQFKGWGMKELAERSPLKPRKGRASAPDRARLAPLEFKSGKAHHTHRAQVCVCQLLAVKRLA